MALGFHLLPQEFCRLASRHSGNLPDLTLPVRERHRAPDDAAALSSALSPASVASPPGGRTNTTTPWPMWSTASTAAGQSSMEMDRRFCEAFDRITRQVAAVSFLQFINAILYCRRKDSQATKRAIAGPQARLHPIQRINEVEGLN